LIARWLARGMTQPLRDMAAAVRRMEVGDYTARVDTHSHDEVGQLATAFNRMSAELELLERSRRDLVANVSHELKTPITAIRAHLENLAVEADRERIHQALFNLVDNAVRFTPPGGGVTIRAWREDDRVQVEVHDTGVGVAPEHLSRLFERFYRADPARSRDDGGGTG